MATIGNRLVAARKAAGLRRVDLAKKTGIAPEVLFRYETDRVVPGAEKVALIAQAIGCTTDAILIDAHEVLPSTGTEG